MKFIDGAMVLSFLTALLYCASTAFTHGFMGVLQLDNAVLDRNLHGIFYDGMLQLLVPIVIGPFALLCFSILISAIIVGISSNIRKKFSYAKVLIKTLRFLWLRKKGGWTAIEKKHFARNFLLVKVVVLSFSFLGLMVHMENKGERDANLLLSKIQAGTYAEVDSIKANIKDMAYLYCGSRNCAALNPSTKEITYFPQEGHVIRLK